MSHLGRLRPVKGPFDNLKLLVKVMAAATENLAPVLTRFGLLPVQPQCDAAAIFGE